MPAYPGARWQVGPVTLLRMSDSEAPAPLRRDRPGAANIIRVAAGVVTAVALLAATVSSLVLLRRFRPDLQLDDIYATDAAVRRYSPRGWVTAHEVSLNVAVVGSIVWAVTTAATVRARSGAATAVMLLATAVVVIGCVVASLTWGLVRWGSDRDVVRDQRRVPRRRRSVEASGVGRGPVPRHRWRRGGPGHLPPMAARSSRRACGGGDRPGRVGGLVGGRQCEGRSNQREPELRGSADPFAQRSARAPSPSWCSGAVAAPAS